MFNEQLAAELERHFRLLWPLKAADRRRVIEEIRLDLIFEEQLNAVREAFA